MEALAAAARPTPEVTASPGAYTVTWRLRGLVVRFEVDRLHDHSDGRVTGRVQVSAARLGRQSEPLYLSSLNLMAGRSRRDIARILDERLPLDADDPPWDQLVETSCRLILEREDAGSPAERLTFVDDLETHYLVPSLVLEGLPTLWYSPGASGKSYLALYIALLVENGLGFFGEPVAAVNTLVLDWEVNREEAGRRITKLANGLRNLLVGADVRLPLYRHCVGCLADILPDVVRDVIRHDIRFIVIDSAGPACGGDILSAEAALRFFDALRKLCEATRASAMILTHTNKIQRQEENQARLPIGSIYWELLPRLTWELRPQESASEDELVVGFFPRKWNVRRPEPLALRLEWRGDAVYVQQAQARDVLSETGATRDMILAELEHGPVSIAGLTEAIGAPAGTVRWHLMKLKDAGRVKPTSRGVYQLVGE